MPVGDVAGPHLPDSVESAFATSEKGPLKKKGGGGLGSTMGPQDQLLLILGPRIFRDCEPLWRAGPEQGG